MLKLQREYDYQEIYDSLAEIGKRYEAFTEFRIIGYSHDERAIPMLQLGKGEEVIFVTAGIHGRERINPVLLVRMAQEYCEAYEKNWNLQSFYEVKKLLDEISICLIPLANPDGYEIAGKGFGVIRNPIYRQALKMQGRNAEKWKYNARGVDLNRNFPCTFYRRRDYREHPASENETRSLVNIMKEKESVGYLDFHSRGKMIYYYRNAMSGFYNRKNQRIAKQLQKLTKYRLGERQEEMKTDFSGGNSVQFYAEWEKRPAITIETIQNQEEFPLNPMLQGEAYQEIYLLPLEFIFLISSCAC